MRTKEKYEDDFFAELGRLYRRLRIERKIKQGELASRAKVSKDTIMAIERGKSTVAIGTWHLVGSILGAGSAWQRLLEVSVDPLEEYDREQRDRHWLEKTRVRS